MVDTNPRPVLGLDLGSATISAGIAEPGGDVRPLNIPVRGRTAPHYRSEVVVDDQAEVRRPDYRGDITQRVSQLTRQLGQPPRVIAGAPYGVKSLLAMAVAPAIDAADTLDIPPTTLAAVVPDHWPDYIVEHYVDALTRTGLVVIPVKASTAISCYAETYDSEGLVTCVNIGARTAALTIAEPVGNRREPIFHRADPHGGQEQTDSAIITQIVAHLDPEFTPDEAWKRGSARLGRAIRRATRKAEHATDMIMVELPQPFGKVRVPAGQITDLVEDVVGTRLRALASSPRAQELWALDEEDGVPRTLVVAGGFSTDKSVGTAIRTEIGAFRAETAPQAIPAMGAARWVAEGRD